MALECWRINLWEEKLFWIIYNMIVTEIINDF